MAAEPPRQYVPLTCHGHSRPVPHLSFSPLEKDDMYYMISACKDGNPMLRDGQTGDWIGTFIGHKGAVWQARLSPNSTNAATASADFTVKIWDTHTGEPLYTIQHNHIVRAIAYPPDNSDLIATGGNEKILRVFDLTETPNPTQNGNPAVPAVIESTRGFEIGEGTHKAPIKFIAWTKDPNTMVTASDNTLRWFDLPTRTCVRQEVLDGEIRSCELVALAPAHTSPDDIGGGLPVLAVAAGKWVYFWGGPQAMDEMKRMELKYTIASVGLDLKGRKLVVGQEPGTWARVIDWDTAEELETHKGHHGPIWSIAFSPDGKLYATGSEDGTIKMWKNCDGFYGLWRGGATAADRNKDTTHGASPALASCSGRRERNEATVDTKENENHGTPAGKTPRSGKAVAFKIPDDSSEKLSKTSTAANTTGNGGGQKGKATGNFQRDGPHSGRQTKDKDLVARHDNSSSLRENKHGERGKRDESFQQRGRGEGYGRRKRASS